MEKTTGIVLRSVKYGDTSLVCTIFTRLHGVQGFMVQGVRTTKATGNKAGLLQPATLLDIVMYHQPQKSLQRMREYSPAIIHENIQSNVVKSTIALFSVEVLLRLLPAEAPLPDLFDFVYEYFGNVDRLPMPRVANFPLYFLVMCSRQLGYEIKERYTDETPHLNLQEGGYTANPPALSPFTSDADAIALDRFLQACGSDEFRDVEMNAAMRWRLLEWYIAFLQRHSQHMGSIKSLPVLHSILH